MSSRGRRDRGPLSVALLNSPEFRRLSPTARWVYAAWTVTRGPDVRPRLARRTGLSRRQVDRALAVLAHSGWIQWEDHG